MFCGGGVKVVDVDCDRFIVGGVVVGIVVYCDVIFYWIGGDFCVCFCCGVVIYVDVDVVVFCGDC